MGAAGNTCIYIAVNFSCHGISQPGSAEKLFNMCDEYADSQKKKSQVWPLQNTLLILCPVSEGDTDLKLL